MRPCLPKTRRTQEICVFCASRIQFLSSQTTLQPRRTQRFFQTSSISHTPAAAQAVLQAEPELEQPPTESTTPLFRPRFGKAYSRSEATVGVKLTLEEQKQREALSRPARVTQKPNSWGLSNHSTSQRATNPRWGLSSNESMKSPRLRGKSVKVLKIDPLIEQKDLPTRTLRWDDDDHSEFDRKPTGAPAPEESVNSSTENARLHDGRSSTRRSDERDPVKWRPPKLDEEFDEAEFTTRERSPRKGEQEDAEDLVQSWQHLRIRRSYSQPKREQPDGAISWASLRAKPSTADQARVDFQTTGFTPFQRRDSRRQPSEAYVASSDERRGRNFVGFKSEGQDSVRRDHGYRDPKYDRDGDESPNQFPERDKWYKIMKQDGDISNDLPEPLPAHQLSKHSRDGVDDPTRPFSARQLLARRSGSHDFEDSTPFDRKRRRRSGFAPKVNRNKEEDDNDDYERLNKLQRIRQRKREKLARKEEAGPTPILLPEFISIGNLAAALRVRTEDFATKLDELGFEDTNNDHVIDAETAGLIASEFNFEAVVSQALSSEDDLVALPTPDDTTFLLSRPPVITIMGHVDHGKTTLLDWLRKSSVAASEHGGITQHIGAFTVNMPSGRVITFLDTPGHAAFLEMRARGANVTDIVILVVAADDSVKPQTIEAIKHAKAARVPMIVAINKIDKEAANAEMVKQDLARHGVEVEDFGGDTQTVCVSGKTGQGMEELEDAAIALADVLDVRADTTGQVEGWVLEATSRKSGRVATVLVRRGTLTPGSVLVAGTTWTRVRSLRNEAGVIVDSASPGTPVEVDGWREQPAAGSEVIQAPDEQRARRAIDFRMERAETERLAEDVTAVNEARRAEELKRQRLASGTEDEESSSSQTQSTGLTEVPFILRADVSGSVEAVLGSVLGLGNHEVRASILRSAVGPLSETDIEHAAIARGHVISFNQEIDGPILAQAEKAGVKVLDGSVIYKLVDDVRLVLEEKLPPSISSKVTGEAEVAQVFEISMKGQGKVPIAGCKVRNGVMSRSAKVRILRGGDSVYDGTLTSLKSQKKDVTEMRKGTECGLGFEEFTAFEVGDQVQCYEVITERRTLQKFS